MPSGLHHRICLATVLASLVRLMPVPASASKLRILAMRLAVKRLPKKVIDLKVFWLNSMGHDDKPGSSGHVGLENECQDKNIEKTEIFITA
ncbi:MAG: hypothetical protein OXD44_01105 [Gammaproteobacteria bacterium]|nr:hypothetical protein [Gammaproteobacteria bacterium]